MTKIATMTLALSLAASTAFAQTTNPPANSVPPGNAPQVVIAGGLGSTGLLIALGSLLLLAGLSGGGDNTGGETTTGGGSSSSSSSDN